jgi:DNA-binding LacI/PurR family transcriptional regulator
MLLWVGSDGEDQQRFQRRVSQNRLMDGLIVASATVDDPFLTRLLQTDLRFVTVERPSHFEDRISYVSLDNVHAAQVAVVHLIKLGRRRIGTITGALDNPDGVERLAGYRQALGQAGMAFDPALVAKAALRAGRAIPA